MEEIRKLIDNHPIVCAVVCTVIVMVLLYYVLVKEGFAKEFTPAPIARQRSASILGVGQPVRYSSEFSGTNQGRGNLVTDMLRSEGMVGHMEHPSIPPLSPENISSYESQARGGEGFSARGMYKEYFGNNVDNKLIEVLHGN
jgi:hypothetical protein